jgi:hypothetical protein
MTARYCGEYGLNNIVTVYLAIIALTCYFPVILDLKMTTYDLEGWADDSTAVLRAVATANFTLLTLSVYMLFDALLDTYITELPWSHTFTRYLMLFGIAGSAILYATLSHRDVEEEKDLTLLISTHYFRSLCIFIPYVSHIIGKGKESSRTLYVLEFLMVCILTICTYVFLLYPFTDIPGVVSILTAVMIAFVIIFVVGYAIFKCRNLIDLYDVKNMARLYVVSGCLGLGMYVLATLLISQSYGAQSWGDTTPAEHVTYFVNDMIAISFLHTLPTKCAQMDFAAYKV